MLRDSQRSALAELHAIASNSVSFGFRSSPSIAKSSVQYLSVEHHHRGVGPTLSSSGHQQGTHIGESSSKPVATKQTFGIRKRETKHSKRTKPGLFNQLSVSEKPTGIMFARQTASVEPYHPLGPSNLMAPERLGLTIRHSHTHWRSSKSIPMGPRFPIQPK